MNRSSFTIIELMLVIGIIGTLSGIVIGAINPQVQLASAADARRRADARTLRDAVLQYQIDYGFLPDSKSLPTSAGNPLGICKNGATNDSCFDASALTPDYLVDIPVDTSEPSTSDTSGYGIYQNGILISVVAMHLGEGDTGSPTDYYGRWDFEDGAGTTVTANYPLLDGEMFNMSSTTDWVSDTPSVLSGSDYSLDFDGSNDYVALPFGYAIGSVAETTVCSWVKSSKVGDQILASFDRSEVWRLSLDDDDTTGIAWDTTGSSGGTNDLSTTIAINDGVWHYLCGWYDADASPNKKLFLDGAVVASTTGHASYSLGDGNERTTTYGFIGVGSEASSFNGSRSPTIYLGGLVDDFRIYHRALTNSEISSLYNGD